MEQNWRSFLTKKAEKPAAKLREFPDSTYATETALAKWDRESLE